MTLPSMMPMNRGEAHVAQTPRDVMLVDGSASLYRFRAPEGTKRVTAPPVLLVPSMINRWYVLDLRKGFSVAEAVNDAGLDTWLLDWGVPRDEDRYLTWPDAVRRLDRMIRRVLRETGSKKVTLLGYCMGATLSSVHAALHPDLYAGFINLLGPIDFSHAGLLGSMTDPRWFDAAAVSDAGNVAPHQMQSGFTLLRPTAGLAKLVGLLDKGHDPAFRESYDALETWAGDNIAFPAAAYRTYIEELYQQNLLCRGQHFVEGRRVDLKNITCPVLTVTAERDSICPPSAAQALNGLVGAAKTSFVNVPGGHVGAVVGSKAAQKLYPTLITWMKERTWT